MSKEEAEQRFPPAPGEDLQMRLAMSLSKEEHEKEERLRRGDDLRLQMAIEESQKQNAVLAKQDKSSLMDLADVFTASAPAAAAANDPWAGGPLDPSSAPVPLALPVADRWGAQAVAAAPGPWGGPQPDPPLAPGGEAWGATPAPLPTAVSDSWDVLGTQPTMMAAAPEPWASVPAPAAPIVTSVDPWAPVAQPLPPVASSSSSPALPETFMDPWEASSPSPPATDSTAKPNYDPFVAPVVNDDFSDFDALRSHVPKSDSGAGEPDLLAGEVPVSRSEGSKSPNLFDLAGMGGALPETLASKQMVAARKTPESFLGPNAALVDLDALVSKSAKTSNPFLSAGGATVASATNPFGAAPPPTMTLNQLRASPVTSLGTAGPHPSISPLGCAMPPAPALSPLVALPPGPLLPATLPAAMPPMVALPTAQNGFGLQPASNTNPFLL